MKLFKVMFFLFTFLYAQDLDFSIFKNGDKVGNTILIIGGIQGDEPSGFNSANLLATKYTIKKGNVWVVPNLNVESIMANSRGIYGDMNRKFLYIENFDPEYKIISRIKSIVLDKDVDAILHLHDGSGFYRDKFIDDLNNPTKWGQCCIIDQKNLEKVKFGNLEELSLSVIDKVNSKLINEKHKYHLKNTHTIDGDKEMEKALTYFAIKNNKPAFAIEASKELPLNLRIYYHLSAIEEYLKLFGVEFERNFNLNPKTIEEILHKNIFLNIFDTKIVLDLSNIKPYINYLPLKNDKKLEFKSNSALVNISNGGDHYKVYIGNKLVSKIYPEYFSYDNSIEDMEVEIDGKIQVVKFGTIIKAKSFLVKPKDGYRVNLIGFTKEKIENESNIKVVKSDFLSKFSIDTNQNIYRVEVYKNDKFSGMFLVDFSND